MFEFFVEISEVLPYFQNNSDRHIFAGFSAPRDEKGSRTRSHPSRKKVLILIKGDSCTYVDINL